MKRFGIEEKYKWDLSSYYKSEEEYLAEVKKLKQDILGIKAFETKLKTSDAVYDCFMFEEQISKRLERAYVYAELKVREDKSISKFQEQLDMIETVVNEYEEMSAFVKVEVSKLSENFITELAKEPRFKNYREHFRHHLRSRKHILSMAEEKILSAVDTFTGSQGDIQGRFEDVDLKFPKVKDSKGKLHELNSSTYTQLMSSADGVLRKNTYIEYHKVFGNFNNFLSANYIASVKETSALTRIRKHDSCLQAALFSEEITPAVYDMLIKKVHENIPLMHKYFEIKRKKLGLKKAAIHDILFAPIVKEDHKNIDYEDAFKLVKEALAPLGEEYAKIIDIAWKERWVDVYPSEGKDSGAFSCGSYGSNPVILMNYTGELNSVFALAHELGHSIHSYFTNKNQPYELSGYAIFVAEVASTVNEMLLLRHLLKMAKTEAEKEVFYDMLLRMIRTTVFRQTMFAEFEQFTHEVIDRKEPLSKDILNKKYEELNKVYYGKDISIPDVGKYEWSRIPHFFMSFYVYKYATGLISALSLSEMIINEPEKVEGYIKFLSGGTSTSPLELMRIAGIDLEKEESFDRAFKFVSDIIEKWEKKNG